MSPRSPCVCSSRGRSVPITRRARHPPRRERTRAWWPASACSRSSGSSSSSGRCWAVSRSRGPFHTLVQPAELLVIGGAAVGTIVVAAPGRLLGSVFRTFLRAFSPKVPTKAEYLELLKLQYEVFVFVRKNGAVALDEHLADIGKSPIFSK